MDTDLIGIGWNGTEVFVYDQRQKYFSGMGNPPYRHYSRTLYPIVGFKMEEDTPILTLANGDEVKQLSGDFRYKKNGCRYSEYHAGEDYEWLKNKYH